MDQSDRRFGLVLGGLFLCGVLVWCVLHFFGGETTDPYSSSYYSMAKEAYKNKDYAKAFQYFQKALEMGDSAAYYGLGHMYQYGKGVPQDYEKSIQNFQNYVRALLHFQRACDMGVKTSCATAKRLRIIDDELERIERPNWPR
ncbi:tetratricopeptide repeat protein [Helicobacter salomonis]|uniref:tetratricopeptide repeat protein n=1 Tax=Helicobacter salomonis TaxID=56878 RepID=UPI001F17B737|nr:tetratricopeptide repeat protein [Helicobacter salomonis]